MRLVAGTLFSRLARVPIPLSSTLLADELGERSYPRARIEMMAILQELQRLGKTIIISSHILSELQTLCNRVAIIEKSPPDLRGPVQGVREDFVWSHFLAGLLLLRRACQRRIVLSEEKREGTLGLLFLTDLKVTMSSSANWSPRRSTPSTLLFRFFPCSRFRC